MKGKVVITGANRGLGYELVKCFHSNHYLVFPLVRTQEAADNLTTEFRDRCCPVIADIRFDECKEIIESTVKKYTNEVDIVINNAGIPGNERQFEKVTSAEMDHLLNVHCLGAMRVVQATLRFLQHSTNPRIINVSSRLGSLSKMASGEFQNRNFTYSYRVAKAAQNMLTICLDQELRKKGICVNAIHPGVLRSGPSSLDANMEAAEAAKNIFDWIETLKIDDAGRFVQPGLGELPW